MVLGKGSLKINEPRSKHIYLLSQLTVKTHPNQDHHLWIPSQQLYSLAYQKLKKIKKSNNTQSLAAMFGQICRTRHKQYFLTDGLR
jgi:hypothetical protein